jgi:hypothetical protein
VPEKLREIAAVFLCPLFLLSAWDGFFVFGAFFTMTNEEASNPDNWSWFLSGPFSFLPAIVLGVLLVFLAELPPFEGIRKLLRYAALLPIAWLVLDACRFTWLELNGSTFRSRATNHLQVILMVSLPMILSASCLWFMREPESDDSVNEPT